MSWESRWRHDAPSHCPSTSGADHLEDEHPQEEQPALIKLMACLARMGSAALVQLGPCLPPLLRMLFKKVMHAKHITGMQKDHVQQKKQLLDDIEKSFWKGKGKGKSYGKSVGKAGPDDSDCVFPVRKRTENMQGRSKFHHGEDLIPETGTKDGTGHSVRAGVP